MENVSGDMKAEPGRMSSDVAPRCLALSLAALVLAVLSLTFSTSPASAAEVHVLSPATIGEGELSLAVATETAPGSGIGVDEATGDVYVADTGNHRIAEYQPDGTFIRAFGSLATPTALAIDNSGGTSEGDVYVADSATGIVSKYDPTGNLITNWGDDGPSGAPNGKLLVQPMVGQSNGAISGLAVSSAGELFVIVAQVEPPGPIYKISPVGTFESTIESSFGTGLAGLAIDAAGNFYKGRTIGFAAKLEPDGESLNGELDNGATGFAVDPADQDVYIAAEGHVDRFGPNEHSIERGLEVSNPGGAQAGLAVGPGSKLYVADTTNSTIDIFDLEEVDLPSASIESPTEVSYVSAQAHGVVDPEGHATTCSFEYVTDAQYQENPAGEKFLGSKTTPCATAVGSGTAPVAVKARLEELRPDTSYHLRLAATNAAGTAVSAEPAATFETEAVSTPIVSIESVNPATIAATTARFVGHINPEAPGPAPQNPAFDVHWHFVCSPECPGLEGEGGTVSADDTSHAVEAEATELLPGSAYSVSLVAENPGTTVTAGPEPFTTGASAPQILSTQVLEVAGSEATLSALVDPRAGSTRVRLEYVTEEQFDSPVEGGFADAKSSSESEPIGSDNEAHEVSPTVRGLTLDTNYRVRVVATNPAGPTYGPTLTVFTQTVSLASGCPNQAVIEENVSLALPDCRVYERVSEGSIAEVSAPNIPDGELGSVDAIESVNMPMRASGDGSRIIYSAEPSPGGAGEGAGNSGSSAPDAQFAELGADGWHSTDVQPLGSSIDAIYSAISPAVDRGVLSTPAEGAPPSSRPDCPMLFSRVLPLGAFHPLAHLGASEACAFPFFMGESTDGSHLVFADSAAIGSALPSAATRNESGPGGGENLYDSSGGSLYLVNILPGSNQHTSAPNATIGAPSGEAPLYKNGANPKEPAVNTSGAVSEDGSRIYWTDGATGIVYVRVNDDAEPSPESSPGDCVDPLRACTVQVSTGEATYETATPDGRLSYYREEGGLWRFDLNAFETALSSGHTVAEADATARSAITPANSGIQGVIGVNRTGPDGAFLYFVATGVLAGNSVENGAGLQTPEEGEPNLYVATSEGLSYIATLSQKDNHLHAYGIPGGVNLRPEAGDWRPVVGYRAAQLAPDGRVLTFQSNRQLTGYSNRGPGGGETSEIYLYQQARSSVVCVSCAPSGAEPSNVSDPISETTFQAGEYEATTQQRRLNADEGMRVYFNTAEALSPSDDNQAEDVYEWEQEGTGSCVRGSAINGGGCVFLLSGARSGEGSALIEPDEDGGSVFFVTGSRLSPLDRDGKPDLYDVREDGGFPLPVTPAECMSADACHASGTSPAPHATPATAEFHGSQELPRSCRKGFARRHAKCVKTRRKHRHTKTHHRGHQRALHGKGGHR